MDNKEIARNILDKNNELGIVKAGSVGEAFTLACIKDALDLRDLQIEEAIDFFRSDLQIANNVYEKKTGEKMWDIEREVEQLKLNMHVEGMPPVLKYHNEWTWGTSDTIIFRDARGFIEITHRNTDQYAYISNLNVFASEHNRGRGRILLHLALSEIKEVLGLKFAMLQVVPDSWVEEWYKRNGFSRLNEGENGFVEMIKPL